MLRNEIRRNGVQRHGCKNDSKTVAKPRYIQIDRLPSGAASTRGVGRVGSTAFRAAKIGRHPTPGIFPDFQFICRHKARTSGRGQCKTRARNANAIVVAIADRNLAYIRPKQRVDTLFLLNFKHPWNIRLRSCFPTRKQKNTQFRCKKKNRWHRSTLPLENSETTRYV